MMLLSTRKSGRGSLTRTFFPKKSYSIFAHVKEKTSKTPSWISSNAVRTIKTDWCEESLIWAWVNMLKSAMKDENNKYFCLLSGEDIPLFTFWQTYDKITNSERSRVHIDNDIKETSLYYADQWVILTREIAQAMIDLKDSPEG